MYVVCINEPRGRNTTMQTLVQVNPFLKTWIPSVAPRRVLCTVWTSTGSGLCKTDFTGCLWAPGPMSIYSKLKCRSKMHSAWLVERGHGVPHPALCPSSFFSLEGNWDVEKRAAVSSSWSGWLWHTQICCRLGCSWLNGTQVPTACHSPEPNPSKKSQEGERLSFQPSQADYSRCLRESLWQGSCQQFVHHSVWWGSCTWSAMCFFFFEEKNWLPVTLHILVLSQHSKRRNSWQAAVRK